jgi:[glutamine synthetase] adenylyltransferase / [glutamine synthetase]-adenylyl-L-tyrosine phosphorylase
MASLRTLPFPWGSNKARGVIDFSKFPKPYAPAQGADAFAALAGTLKQPNQGETKAMVVSLAGHSPYLAHLMARFPETLEALGREPPERVLEAAMADAAAPATGRAEVMAALRRLKGIAALVCAACEVSGAWPIETSAEHLSAVADLALKLLLEHLLGRAEAARSGFVVLALGKHGSRRVNYSSDIDLILLYDQDKVRVPKGKTPSAHFTKIAHELVSLLQDRTGDGYVFRVDLRLRPDPGTTPPAISFAAAEVYYQSVAETWERAAMIKARVAAGDAAAGADFLNRIRHFMWRRRLDFAAVEDIHAIKDRIRRHYGHGAISVRGHDLKIGEGGIRSIEFFVQIHQLIAGGRDPSLRTSLTTEALSALAEAKIIDRATALQLTDAYRFLRSVEHRLQMIHDEQTHTLPPSAEGMAGLASFMGFKDGPTFEAKLLGTFSLVKRHYDALPGAGRVETPAFLAGEEALSRHLARLGFSPKAAETVGKWRRGPYKALKSERARRLFDALLPEFLETFAQAPDADRTLALFDQFLARLPAGVQIFALFQSNPWVLKLVGKILTAAPALAEELARRPALLDFVLAPAFFEGLPGKPTLERSLKVALGDAADYQDVLDVIRRWAAEMRFQVGIYVLEGLVGAREAGAALADIVEVTLAGLYPFTLRDFEKGNGRLAKSQMAIVALGSFGGRELTFTSDLDLVLLYDARAGARTEGKKPVSASHYFIRLGQHFLTALSANMASGKLYDVDLRLRPSGRWGPLVVTLKAFAEYQRGAAWTYEHMALTRARVITASPAFAKRIERAIAAILTRKRPAPALAKHMDEVREKYAAEFKADDPFDVRHVRGGVLDAEYIAIFHLLRLGHAHPKIFSPDFDTALANLLAAGALGEAEYRTLAHGRGRLFQVYALMRLCWPERKSGEALPEPLERLMAEAAGVPAGGGLAAKLRETEAAIYALYQRTIPGYGEGGRGMS